MNLLLDTHVWYWFLEDPRRLTKRVASTLRRSSGQLWVSPISSWELFVLVRKGRLKLKPDAATFVMDAWKQREFREATVTQEVVMAIEQVWLPHNDPADTFLAATARAYGLTLVTADESILQGRGFSILANR